MGLFKRGLVPVVAFIGAAMLGGTVAFFAASAAGAAGSSGGAAVIVNPANNAALAGGGSTTVWTFDLPAAPADRCTGDSATQGYFVYTYITPIANNPADLTFSPSQGPNQPAGSFAYPLFDSSGSPFISRNTAPSTGQVAMFPATQFNWTRFSIDGRSGTIPIPAGSYNVGVSCNGPSGHDRFWNAIVTFSASGGDPSGEAWVAGEPTPPTTTTVAPTTTTVAPTTTTVAPTTTTVAPTTTTTVAPTTTTTVAPTTTTAPPTTTTAPPTDPCLVPNGLLSGPVYRLSPALAGVARALCGLGL